MSQLLLHPALEKQIEAFIQQPGQALTLIGPAGSGKLTLSLELAARVLGLNSRSHVTHYPYCYLIVPEQGTSISIAQIRAVQDKLRLKTPGTRSKRRVVIIEAGHAMHIEAQQAFLKTLEEPPSDTLLILNIIGQSSLLPTVYSRCQQITMKVPAESELIYYFTHAGFSKDKIERAYRMSGGRTGLMTALLQNDANHPLVGSIADAKRLLGSSVFDRLKQINELVAQKQNFELLIDALECIAHAGLMQSIGHNAKNMKRWQHSLSKLYETREAMVRNANSKLLLTDMLLDL